MKNLLLQIKNTLSSFQDKDYISEDIFNGWELGPCHSQEIEYSATSPSTFLTIDVSRIVDNENHFCK